jgi:hypothetical protein
MRRLVGCLGLVLAAACGGSSSGGGSVAPPQDDGGVIIVNDGGTVSPTPDAGQVADAGAPPPQADGGSATPPPTDGGTTTTPPSDGGTTPPPADGGTASACDGLAPGPVGAPSGSVTTSLPLTGYSCGAAVNGSGGLALYEYNDSETPDATSNRTDFFAPDGTPRGTRFRGSSPDFVTPMLGRLNAFFDTEVAHGHYEVVAQDDHGGVLRTTITGYTAQLVNDPLGGAMLWGFDVSDFGEKGPFVLSAFDDAGALRFQLTLDPQLGNAIAGLVVDQQGNALVLTVFVDKSGASTSGLMGQWITHDGKVLPPFAPLPPDQNQVNEVFARVGGGVFFRTNADWWQLDSLASTVSRGPDWLFALTDGPGGFAQLNVFMARNSRAYAVIGLTPNDAGFCAGDEVQLIAPNGEICGKATFPPGSNGCAQRTIGYDGTLVQIGSDFGGSSNSCVWQWWTGFFH